jgi:cysteine synthase
MYGSNIERLKRDSKEIKHYIKKVEKDGNTTLAYKLRQKYEYLNSYIHEIEEEEEIC